MPFFNFKLQTSNFELHKWIPHLFTLGNLAFGFIVIWLALEKREEFSENPAKFLTPLGLLLLVACLCDFLDGFFARRIRSATSIGIELDSLVDFISFGVAPVIVFYVCLFDSRPSIFSFAACLSYLAAGAWRLARFNQSALSSAKTNTYFEGLPITGSSFLLATLLLFLGQDFGSTLFEGYETELRRAMILLFAILGLLMVSHLPYRSLKTPVQKPSHFRIYTLIVLVAGLVILVRFGFEVALILIPLAYIFGTPLAMLAKKFLAEQPDESSE